MSRNMRYMRLNKDAKFGRIRKGEYYRKLVLKQLQWERKRWHYDALVKIAERIVATASREQSYREVELRHAFGKPGQGLG